MNHMELQYFKTDKNGTKYFYDYKCPRCAGYGMLDKWINTGKVCYACGGSGTRCAPKIVKEYSPEYWAKLEAKRQAKAAKEAEEKAKYAAEHPEELAEKHRQHMLFIYAEHGCNEDGISYLVTGKTYPVKDQIKKAGGRWIMGQWFCPVEIKADGVKCYPVNIGEHLTGMGWKDDGFDLSDFIWEKTKNW